MSYGKRELLADGGFDLPDAARSDIEHTISVFTDFRPGDSKWITSKTGALTLCGRKWLAEHDLQWPSSANSNAFMLCGAAGNEAGHIAQNIIFTRSGRFTLVLLMRAGIKGWSSSTCSGTELVVQFDTGSEKIQGTGQWTKYSLTGALPALLRNVKTGTMQLLFREAAVKPPCASAIAALSVTYSVAAVARLLRPALSDDSKLLVESDRNVEELAFNVTEGLGGPPLIHAWVECMLTGSGYGLSFTQTAPLLIQCDGSGKLTLPAGTLHAGKNVKHQLKLVVDGDTALILPVESSQTARVTKLIIVSGNHQSQLLHDPAEFTPLTVRAVDQNDEGVHDAKIAFSVMPGLNNGAVSCQLTSSSRLTSTNGNATVRVVKGAVPEIFRVKAICGRSEVIFDLALLPAFDDLVLLPSGYKYTLRRDDTGHGFFAKLVTKNTSQGWPYVKGGVRSSTQSLRIEQSNLITDPLGVLAPRVTVYTSVAGEYTLEFYVSLGSQTLTTHIKLSVNP